MDSREVDVVIPTLDARERISACLRELSAEHAVSQIIVVDDSSTDGTAELISAEFPHVTVVQLQQSSGLSYALNQGLARCDAPYVLFLNDDVVPRAQAVSMLRDALACAPHAACAGGRLVDPGTETTQASYQPRAIPGLLGLLARITGIERGWPANPLTGQHLRRPLPIDRPSATDRQLAGACLLVRRELAVEVGGWDERFPFWYEDVDFSRRLRPRGPALYVPDAVFDHIGAASTRAWSKAEQHARLYRGTLVYGQAHLGRCAQSVLAAVMLLVCALRGLAALGTGEREQAGVYRRLAADAIQVGLLRALPAKAPGG
jgi:GT2 family glycosyltransferase